MRMIGADIHTELSREMVAQRRLGKHSFNCPDQELSRVFPVDVGGCSRFEPSRIPAVVTIELGLHFVTSQVDLLCVDDHDMVSEIDVRSKRRSMLPAQKTGDSRGQAAQGFAFRVDEIPFLLHIGGFFQKRCHCAYTLLAPSESGFLHFWCSEVF